MGTVGEPVTICAHMPLELSFFQFREFIQKIREWKRSPSRWIRRAGAVAMIYSIRTKRHLGAVFEFS
jgi:hypothetical protein